MVSPGYVATRFADSVTSPAVRAQAVATSAEIAIPPEAVACAIAYAIGQPAAADVGDIVVRPTAQA